MKTIHKTFSVVSVSVATALALSATGAFAAKPGSPTLPACAVYYTDNAAEYCNDEPEFELQALCIAIEDAGPPDGSLKDRDAATMKSKDYGAVIKINEEKYEDAASKLMDIEYKLDQLVNAAKPKISEDDADAISGALIDAQLCVDAL